MILTAQIADRRNQWYNGKKGGEECGAPGRISDAGVFFLVMTQRTRYNG